MHWNRRSVGWLAPLLAGVAVVVVVVASRFQPSRNPADREDHRAATEMPSDWFGVQRAFPQTSIPPGRYARAVLQAQVERQIEAQKPQAAALTWTNAGPYQIGGRVTALAAAPGGNPVYLGAANGGVFKSTNSGVNWTPVFDALAVYSIGAVTLEPGTTNVLYVGTGEANASVDSYDGAGLFRTPDGGSSWEFLGLENTARIGRVAVDPTNPNRIFVAAMGQQFSSGPDRGLYRSLDRGVTWNRVLFVNDSTGVSDVVINPVHPDTVYAASWERIRRPSYRRAFGPGSGVWRSIDAGTSWTRLANGLPAPSDSVGRIGLALAASRPSVVYAQIMSGANLGYVGLGMYRTTNGGASWTRRDTGTSYTSMFGGFGWYFGETAVDPANFNRVYALGVSVKRSNDGGVNFTAITGGAHVDQHALWIDPTNPARIYLGNDGGFWSTTTGASPWTKSVDLPITQFYACAVDPSNGQRRMGGTQDNNTLLSNGDPFDWFAILGGDGFQCLFHPHDPLVLFAEWQNCSSGSGLQRSTNGGSTFNEPLGFDSSDRFNWSTPIVMDPNQSNTILVGSQRVYRSTNNGLNYDIVSGDLSTNPPASLVYGTLTTLEISPRTSSLYFAGTDDGRVWRSQNSGGTWENISAGLPVRWVTRVTADRFDSQVVYVTLSGFGRDETDPHVFRSANRGTTWTPIAGNLPDAPVNDLVVDPFDRWTLFAATDVGVYATRNLGASWFPLGTGMPLQTIFDLEMHVATHTLTAATHGRGMWGLDLAGLPTDVAAELPAGLRLAVPVPNPSRGVVRLGLDLPADAGAAQVTIYDVAGRVVRTLHRGALGRGAHALDWDGRDARGTRVAAGVYFVRAEAEGAARIQRLVREP